MDSEEHRLAFILEGQQHCDHFLTPIADPAGKSVLVAGSGAGTEMLWCLRHGAREVVGVDVAPQTAHALHAACDQMHLQPNFTMHQIAIEDATQLDRRFNLVLSNNVFEHVGDIPRSLSACGQLVAEDGRIAIFTDPLFYSSSGSHLQHQPWEHLWGDVESLGEIPLNRMRLADFIEAVRASGLVLLNLRVIVDRNVQSLPDYRDKLGHVAVSDLTIEGIAAELVRVGNADLLSAEERLLSRERQEHANKVAGLQSALERERGAREEERKRLTESAQHWMSAAAELKHVLDEVEHSWSFRIGRAITAPMRGIRGRWWRERRR